MTFRSVSSINPVRLHYPLMERHRRNEAYRPAPGLREAMDIAMLLGMPLLLTGDPGTGKTRAAHWLAGELDLKLETFDVKSTTSGTDLLYSFDEVGRFRDASRREERPLISYLRFNALGLAFLRSAGSTATVQTAGRIPLEGENLIRHREQLERVFGAEALEGQTTVTNGMLRPDGSDEKWDSEHQVVLIDELDKAPRDTPNDLLAEVEELSFAIPELGIRVSAQSERRPIIIITSNSEKSLPDPFLRRCAYFHIDFPTRAELMEILDHTLDLSLGNSFAAEMPLLNDAASVLLELRARKSVRRPPGTAEFLAWIDVLLRREELSPHQPLAGQLRGREEVIDRSVGVLFKSDEDIAEATRLLRSLSAS